MGSDLEEELIDFLGLCGEEQLPQFFGQRKGDHEVRRANALAKFALHPLRGGVLAALRAGAVVATVEVEFLFAARAGIEVPTHFLGAAMSDGPDGALLCLAHRVTMLTQMGGQKAAQGFNDSSSHRF